MFAAQNITAATKAIGGVQSRAMIAAKAPTAAGQDLHLRLCSVLGICSPSSAV